MSTSAEPELWPMEQRRRRFRQTEPLRDRLEAFAKDAREKAAQAFGPKRDELIKKARRAETAAHIDDWANSAGLQPPK